jgi:mannose-1-phosphate guanylyltransferase / mannose-6-phosphate isomerase
LNANEQFFGAPTSSNSGAKQAHEAAVQVLPVIMAGGSGTRLWPLSRASHPKQFLNFVGDDSLFQQAVARLCALADDTVKVMAPVVVGNEEHRFMVLEQLRTMGTTPAAVLLEPMGRNTAPAVTLAALQALQGGQDPVLVITPADQTVTDPQAFNRSLRQAAKLAAQGSIVILGIQPDRAETGYGYIRAEAPGDAGACKVVAFVEKPDQATAQGYLTEGGYYWNAGMFVLRASAWMRALERYRPDIAQACQAAWAVRQDDSYFVRPGKAEFAAVPAESVDYAVMEHCPGGPWPLQMVPLAAGWSDLGAWDAVWEVAPKDAQGNASSGDAVLHDTRDTLVHATSRLVTVIGVSDLVVVETPDAVMVVNRQRSQDVKHVVEALKARSRNEHAMHRLVHRPWGWYDSIDAGARFQVKRIVVKPGASLSLQMHHHRAEHWIVVSGTAEVTCGDKRILLSENQGTYIPLGEKHRLANPGKVPLEMIEVQSGSYLGEDDIVRFDDAYGRG